MRFSINHALWRIKNPLFHTFWDLDLIDKDCILAGGSLRAIFDKTDLIKDFDLFFTNRQKFVDIDFKLERLGFECVFLCPKGELKTYKKDDMKIQLITKIYYPNVSELLRTFDINACRFATDGEFLYCPIEAIRDVKKKRITLFRVDYPNATFKRMLKYRDKGYKITNESIESFVDEVYAKAMIGDQLNKQFYID